MFSPVYPPLPVLQPFVFVTAITFSPVHPHLPVLQPYVFVTMIFSWCHYWCYNILPCTSPLASFTTICLCYYDCLLVPLLMLSLSQETSISFWSDVDD